MSCVVRPFNTIVGSAAINESILSMKSMPADGKSNSVTGRNRRSSCKGGKCASSGLMHRSKRHVLMFCRRSVPLHAVAR